MKSFVALLKLFGLYREPSIANIASPIGKIVDRLNTYAAAQNALAAANRANAAKLMEEADKASCNDADAVALAQQYSSLILTLKFAAE